jgi:cell wall-associated NlpC family hydrolase
MRPGDCLTDNRDISGMRPFRLLPLLFGLACTIGCASAGGVPEPFPRPAARPSPGAPPAPVATSGTVPGADGYSITGTALGLRGTPYRNGGADPRGFDCSGFVEYVFAQHGIAVPRTVEGLYRTGTNVPRDEIEAGDLLFFATTAPGASHVGMAIGGDEFVHAPSSTGVVRVERLSGGYWSPRFVAARRLVGD